MVADAYAHCLRLAQAHYENFPVASRLVRREDRPHIAALYAFARTADDFADEGDRTPEERLVRLHDWGVRLRQAAAGRVPADGTDASLIFTALEQTMHERRLEPQLFEDLLSAFRQDVTVRRYATWADLLDYCRRSANPVGRLVLRISGYRDGPLDDASDAVCTALQLTNFWQDLERDWAKGRLYVPAEILAAHGAETRDLDQRQLSPAWREALGDCARRTRALFDRGRPVADAVAGRLRWELRATWLGGRRILDRLEAAAFDVYRARPSLGVADAIVIGGGVVFWRASHADTRAS